MIKKILIITNHSYMLYQFRRELIGKLLEVGEVTLSMPFTGHEREFENLGCKCVQTNLKRRGINPFLDFELFVKYWVLLKKEKPDVVMTYSIKPNIYGGLACSLRGIPYYSNVQGLGTAFQKKWLSVLVSMLYKTAFLKVRKVFFENRENAREFTARRILKNEKIAILNGAGVNLNYYSYEPYPQNQEFHFLYLGRIMKEKGIDELFSAVIRLKKEYGSRVILDLVGFFEDSYAETVEKLCKKNMIVFHGFQEETRPYYEKSDCVILPSWHEGMSNVLLEAAAMGRPLITSDIPGCREAVEDGKSGFLVPRRNGEILYQKMKAMMEMSREQRERMGQLGRKKMEKEFDKDFIVNQTIQILFEKDGG